MLRALLLIKFQYIVILPVEVHFLWQAFILLCAAKDPATSLVGYAMFNVTVKDTSPPTFKVPHSILKQADDLQGANITYDANASDTVDGNTVTTCDPPSGSFSIRPQPSKVLQRINQEIKQKLI